MPKKLIKTPKQQSDTKKSEIEDLFIDLCNVYSPRSASPTFFPIPQIAQARVWRRQRPPNANKLNTAINQLCLKGAEQTNVRVLIGLCESLFRPLRAYELGLEEMFPQYLCTRSTRWPPSRIEYELLKYEFRQLWRDKEKQSKRQWVLAVGPTPLPIKHRPRLMAPWVIAVVIKRWLIYKSVPEGEAMDLSLSLGTILLGQEMRAEELHHWQALLEKIHVTTEKGKVLLPAYIMKDIQFPNTLCHHMTPATFLQIFPIDAEACRQFVWILSRAWITPDKRPKRLPVKVTSPQARKLTEAAEIPNEEELLSQNSDEQTEKVSEERDYIFDCLKCKNQFFVIEEFWQHLKQEHEMDDNELEIQDTRRQIRRKSTGELLARWRKIHL